MRHRRVNNRMALGGMPDNGLDDESSHPQIRLWIYRLLFQLEIYKAMVREKDFMDDGLARLLGFGDMIDGVPDVPAFDRAQIIARMRAQWQEAERDYARSPVQTERVKSAFQLGCRLGFTDVECEILHRAIQHFFDCRPQAVDFVDEENVAALNIRQDRSQVPRLLDRRSCRKPDLGSHF